MRTIPVRWTASCVFLVAAGSWVLAQVTKPADPLPAGRAEPAPMRTKVFRLQNCDPGHAQQVLEGLLGWDDQPGPGRRGSMRDRGGIEPGPVPGPGGLPGLPSPPGAGGFSGGGFPGASWGRGPSAGWRLSVDARTKSLILRARDKNLDIAADVIAVLDTPSGKALPTLKHVRAFQLKHATAEDLHNILVALGYDARFVPTSPRLLIAAGPESELKELADVVKELDVPGKETPK